MNKPSKTSAFSWEIFMEDLLTNFTVEEWAILNKDYSFSFEKVITTSKDTKNKNDTFVDNQNTFYCLLIVLLYLRI